MAFSIFELMQMQKQPDERGKGRSAPQRMEFIGDKPYGQNTYEKIAANERGLAGLIGRGMEIPTKAALGYGKAARLAGRAFLGMPSEDIKESPVYASEKLNKTKEPKKGTLKAFMEKENKGKQITTEKQQDITPVAKPKVEVKPEAEAKPKVEGGEETQKNKLESDPKNKLATESLVAAMNQQGNDEAKGELGKKYIDEFMGLMPEYEGKSGFEKGMDLMKFGMAIAAGESPNAIANISKGFLAMGDTFTEDAKERRAFKNQVKVSAAKYAMEQLTADRAAEKDLQYFFNKDGDMEVLSKADLMAGKRPSEGFTDASMAEATMRLTGEREAAALAALEGANLSEPEAKEYRTGYKTNINLLQKAELGVELTEGILGSLAEKDTLTGLQGASRNLAEKARAMFNINPDNYRNENGEITEKSRQQLINDMRKVFQLMIPLTLGEAQSANSISDRDVSILSKAAAADILNEDPLFGDLSTTSRDALVSKLQNAHKLFRNKAIESKAMLDSLDTSFANKIITDLGPDNTVRKRRAEVIVDPFRQSGVFARGKDKSKVISLSDFESAIQKDLAEVKDEELKDLSDEEIEGLPMYLQERAKKLNPDFLDKLVSGLTE